MSTHALTKLLPEIQKIDVCSARAWDIVCSTVHETACAIHGGHDYLLHASGNRLCLRCAACGHETPGWRIDVRRDGRNGRSLPMHRGAEFRAGVDHVRDWPGICPVRIEVTASASARYP